MKRLTAILRGSMHTIIAIIMMGVISLYVFFHFNLAGLLMEHSLTDMLADKLNTRVTVEGDVEVDWSNQVVLNQLTIYDQHDDTLLYARRVMVAYDLWPLLQHHLVLNTCQLIDFDIRARRSAADSTSNYQFVLDALTDIDQPDSQPFVQQVDLNAIFLRKGFLSYDVTDKPHNSDWPVDPNHISISQLSANVHVHDKELLIKKFHCYEHENAIKIARCKVALDLADALRADDGSHRPVIDLQALEMQGPQIALSADLIGDSDALRLHIAQIDLPNGHVRLPEIDRLHAEAEICVTQLRNSTDSLHITAELYEADIQSARYGNYRANVKVEGMPCQATLQASLTGERGQASLNADIVRPHTQEVQLRGHCSAYDIDLAQLLAHNYQLGKASADFEFDIERQDKDLRRVNLDGTISSLEWRGHNYHDALLSLSGGLPQLTGHLSLADSLGNVTADICVEQHASQRHYSLTSQIEHLNPNALRLTDITPLDSVDITTNITADIVTSSHHDTEMKVSVKDFTLHRGEELQMLGTFNYTGSAREGRLSSPLASFSYDQRPNNKQYMMSGRIAVANDVLQLLRIPVKMSRDVSFEIRMDSLQQLSQCYLDLPRIDINDNYGVVANFRVNDDERGLLYPILDLEVQTAKYKLSGTMKAIVEGHISKGPMTVSIAPTTFKYNQDDIQLAEARISRTQDGLMQIENIKLKGGMQELAIAGQWDNERERDFTLSLDNFDLGQIFNDLPKGYMHFGGRATGDIHLSSDPVLHLYTDSLKIRHMAYIDTLLGDGNLSMDYRIAHKRMKLSCDIVTDQKYQTSLECDLLSGKRDTLDLRILADHLPLGFINNWSGNILQQFRGRVTGGVRVYGDVKMLQLEGSPTVDGHFTHNTIGANFHFNDIVKLRHNLIHLDHIQMDDEHGHPMELDARVTHDHLHKFGYDVTIDMPDARQGFLLLNREKKSGRTYWGQIYAKGKAKLTGGNGKHRFDIDVTPTERSWFYLSPREQDINPDQDIYAFLKFRDKEEVLRQLEAETLAETNTVADNEAIQQASRTQIDVVMKINATEDCEVSVKMDPTSDDLLVCRGNGGLTLNYNPRKDITLSGTYGITQGTYTMNVKPDLMNKVFKLQNSSSIRFNGVPSEAELGLDARYNIPSVNLYTLGENITAMNSLSRSSVPLDCILNVMGQLSTPQVSFDLELKNVSEEVNTNVRSIIGTPEMLNQEVLYLLLFSKFYTPQYAQSSQNRAGSEISSFASASITSQLNQLLNRLSDNFTMGTNFRSDRGDFTDMEMDVSLSTRLLNNRLLLYGNLGYRDPAKRINTDGSNTLFVGDFDIEYLINRNIRAKAYNHYNERDYSINNALTTQGAGFVLRRDFNSLSDFWWWKNKK